MRRNADNAGGTGTSRVDRMLAALVAWAAAEDAVRRLVLVGSRARPEVPDDLADIDVQVYCDRVEPFTSDDAWLAPLAAVWINVRDQYADGDLVVPTRLVIFDGGVKVDFAFYPAATLSRGVRAGLAHRVLVDKTGRIPTPVDAAVPPAALPTASDYRRAVDEFWFEAYHAAKYLARDELWLATARDWAAKQWLWQMIVWHELICRQHAEPPWHDGRRAVAGAETWRGLHDTFAAFDADAGWRALEATIRLFRQLATDLAQAGAFSYPEAVDANLSTLIGGLKP
jgi:aminoglycoside 6-adenylyltransferase